MSLHLVVTRLFMSCRPYVRQQLDTTSCERLCVARHPCSACLARAYFAPTSPRALQKLDEEFPDTPPLYPSDPAVAADAEAAAELERGLATAGYRHGVQSQERILKRL